MPGSDQSHNLILLFYCLAACLASLAGGWIILFVKLTHRRLQIATSFVAGLMLGISILHFLPDAMEKLHSAEKAALWLLAGFLGMFFLQRFFHFHHHDLPEGDPEDCCHEPGDNEPGNHVHDLPHEAPHAPHHDHGHDHDHGQHAHTLAEKSAKQLSWAGTALGLTLHSLFDGLALAVAVEAGGQGHARLAGAGVALAVILHKPFDAMAVSTLMTVGGRSKFFRHFLNALFALATPLGAALYHLGAAHFADSQSVILGCTLAFCAGTFLCISSSDLLPELQFHSHDRFKLSFALIAGLLLAVLIGLIEKSNDTPSASGKESVIKQS
jgi:zinc and cadmium transporter